VTRNEGGITITWLLVTVLPLALRHLLEKPYGLSDISLDTSIRGPQLSLTFTSTAVVGKLLSKSNGDTLLPLLAKETSYF
jgi:hypothetical protein